jgi:hypothetical protein
MLNKAISSSKEAGVKAFGGARISIKLMSYLLFDVYLKGRGERNGK